MSATVQSWPLIPLGELTENFDGVRVPVKEADRKPGPYPYYGASGIVDWVDGYLFDGEYLLIAEDGENLRTRQTPIAFMATGKFWVNNHAHIVRANKKSITRYLMYALWRSEIGAYLTGSTMPKLTQGNLNRIPIPAPPLPVQERIADILGSLDDKIEANQRTNATLEAMARTLFRSWFVDFDPVRAKADGRRPPGLDAATAALFPDAFEDSRLGPIPKGWRVVNLPEAIEVNPPRSLRKETVSPYLDMGNMPTASARALDWEMRECGSGAKFINGDVLLARITPCLENGKTAFVDFLPDGEVGWGSTEYIVLRSKPPLPVEYVYFLARSDELRTHAIRNMTGTSGRQRVPADCFNSYPVVVPPEPLARRFGEFSRSAMQSMKSNDEQSRNLAAMRDTLLPKLLSGEVKVAHHEPVE
jgi:type I restriction enzyme S subunit